MHEANGQTADRLAVVTGGSSGIGRAVAMRLLEDGYRCATIDRAPAPPDGADLWAVQADVSVPADVARAFGAIEERFARTPDTLVCAAGIVGEAAAVEDMSPAAWDEVIAVDLTGVFLCCRRAVPAMRRQRFGRIVNIASIAGKEGNARMAAYSAAKAGVIGFTKALAKEVVDDGLTVNAIAPGLVRTPLVEGMAPDVRARLTEAIPMRRIADAAEIAAAVSFLIREASFSTGSVLDASGGRATY
jgi:2-dehydro-3-deoxy-L-rhamnonate dehydrogenase (NAD+)